jgi:hypothetical protein
MSIRIINSGSTGAPDVAVVGLEFLVQIGQRHPHKDIHSAQEVVVWDTIFEPEVAEQLALVALAPPHLRRPIIVRAPAADQAQMTESPFGRHLKPLSTASTLN